MKPRRYKQWVVQFLNGRTWIRRVTGRDFYSKKEVVKDYDWQRQMFPTNRWRIIERTITERVVR